MAILHDQYSSQIADALVWAAGYVDFHSSERVTDHPWAKTYALRGVSSTTYLKIVPEAGAGSRKALAQIASIFSNDVPQLISSHLDQGFFLYEDFKGRVLAARFAKYNLPILERFGIVGNK